MQAGQQDAKASAGDREAGGSELLAIELAPHAGSASRARAALTGLSPALPKGLVQELQLLVSGLVTSSLRHAGLGPRDVIDLRVRRLHNSVRVEVVDPGRRFAPAVRGRPSGTGGWGLHIVDRVAARWGVEVPHNRVWFELWLDPS